MIYSANKNISGVYLGKHVIIKAYLGDTLIWQGRKTIYIYGAFNKPLLLTCNYCSSVIGNDISVSGNLTSGIFNAARIYPNFIYFSNELLLQNVSGSNAHTNTVSFCNKLITSNTNAIYSNAKPFYYESEFIYSIPYPTLTVPTLIKANDYIDFISTNNTIAALSSHIETHSLISIFSTLTPNLTIGISAAKKNIFLVDSFSDGVSAKSASSSYSKNLIDVSAFALALYKNMPQASVELIWYKSNANSSSAVVTNYINSLLQTNVALHSNFSKNANFTSKSELLLNECTANSVDGSLHHVNTNFSIVPKTKASSCDKSIIDANSNIEILTYISLLSTVPSSYTYYGNIIEIYHTVNGISTQENITNTADNLYIVSFAKASSSCSCSIYKDKNISITHNVNSICAKIVSASAKIELIQESVSCGYTNEIEKFDSALFISGINPIRKNANILMVYDLNTLNLSHCQIINEAGNNLEVK